MPWVLSGRSERALAEQAARLSGWVGDREQLSAAALDLYKTGPLSTTSNQATYTILVTNPSTSVAGNTVR